MNMSDNIVFTKPIFYDKIYCNLCLVFNYDKDKILLLKRNNEPFKDKLNAVGGKRDTCEDKVIAMIRELKEEIGIENSDVHKAAWLLYQETTINNIKYSMDVFYIICNKDIDLEKFAVTNREGYYGVYNVKQVLNEYKELLAGSGSLEYYIKYCLSEEGCKLD